MRAVSPLIASIGSPLPRGDRRHRAGGRSSSASSPSWSSFGFIRTSTHMIRAQVSWWPGNVSVGGTHIHHLVWGILLLLLFGWIGVAGVPGIAVAGDRRRLLRDRRRAHPRRVRALAQPRGRLLGEAGAPLHRRRDRRRGDRAPVPGRLPRLDRRGPTASRTRSSPSSAGSASSESALALVNVSKEKFGMALLGLFFPPVAVWSAPSAWQAELAVGRSLLPPSAAASGPSSAIKGPRGEPFWKRGPGLATGWSRPTCRAEPSWPASASRAARLGGWQHQLVEHDPERRRGRDGEQRAQDPGQVRARPAPRRSPPPGSPSARRPCT